MRKYILIILILLLCTIPFNVFAENKVTDAGNSILKVGLLFNMTYYMSGFYEGANKTTDTYIGFVPTSASFEHFLFDNLSLGLSGYWNSNKVEANYQPSDTFLLKLYTSYYIILSDTILLDIHAGGSSIYILPYDASGYTYQSMLGAGVGVTWVTCTDIPFGFYFKVTYNHANDAGIGGKDIPGSGYDMINIDMGVSLFLRKRTSLGN